MFESIRPARRRPPRLIVVLSIAAHACALVALVATAMWQVDKLGVDDAPLLVASGPGAPLPSAGDDAPEPERPKKQKARRARDLAQVDRSTAEAEEDEGGDGGKTDATGKGTGPGDDLGTGLFPCGEGGSCSVLARADAPSCGDRRIEGSEECDDGNRVAGDGCSASCRHEKELVVPPRLVEGKRVLGNPQIPAPEGVRQQMIRSATPKLTATVKMCLDRAGRVRSLQVMESTGFREYDQKLLAGMRTWVYQPYQLANGTPVPVCTAVTFIYRVQ